MGEVAVRDLCNRGTEILSRVASGEALIVTCDGEPIAELRPLPRRPLPAGVLLQRWRRLPAVDPALLRADIDTVLGTTLNPIQIAEREVGAVVTALPVRW